MSSLPAVRVVAAVLYDGDGRVLVTQRPAGKALAGLWEFPGGKLEAGESAGQALRRELREELGIEVEACAPLMELQHDYPDRRVLLAVWTVGAWRGEPAGLEGQPLQWLAPARLPGIALLPADLPIVDRITSRNED